MGMKEIIISSVRYSSSNWVRVILLGLVIFLADRSNELSSLGGMADELRYVIILVGLVLGIYQLGFIFRVVEETTHGSDRMPKFDKFKKTFLHGVNEFLVMGAYFIVPLILILIAVFQFIDVAVPNNDTLQISTVIFALFLASLTYLVFQAVVLNMANHHGTIRSAFDFKEIFKKTREIGFKKLTFIYILTVVFAFTVEGTLSDVATNIPYDLGSIVVSFLISPFILIFIARILGSINRTLEIEKA